MYTVVSNVSQIASDAYHMYSPWLLFQRLLVLPAAGLRSSTTGACGYQVTNGYYWSSGISGANASLLHLGGSTASVTPLSRASGLSVRCVQEMTGCSFYTISLLAGNRNKVRTETGKSTKEQSISGVPMVMALGREICQFSNPLATVF